MKSLWLAALLMAVGLAGCSEEAKTEAEPVQKTEEMTAPADNPAAEMQAALRGEVQVITITGNHPESLGVPEATLADREVIDQLQRMMAEGEFFEGGVYAIGPDFAMNFKWKDGRTENYEFYFDRLEGGGFEQEGEAGRFLLTEQNANKVQDIFYEAMEEETGELQGVYIYASNRELTAENLTLLMNIHNNRKITYSPQDVRIQKLTSKQEWIPFPAGESSPIETITCPQFSSCEWKLDLTRLAADWPIGEYRLTTDAMNVVFVVK